LILGGAASALFLYGSALLYGATGSLNIAEILKFAKENSAGTLLYGLGTWLVVFGFLFKVASVPFHMWMPDVYEGASAPVTGFMTTALKAAVFATFVRVFISMGYGPGDLHVTQAKMFHFLWITSVVTMFVGNVIALTQTNLKRMLAYSSIAHTGYILVGFVIGGFTDQGYAPVLFYLVSYSVMNLGAFVVLTVLADKGDNGLNLHDLSGLSQRHPLLALSLSVFVLSMLGLPTTAGFIAKYWLFYSGVQAGEIWLIILGVLCSAISAFYYLRILVYMYMTPATKPAGVGGLNFMSVGVILVLVVLTLAIGLYPAPLLEFARTAITRL
jgi:NADH-quinone oxidoreductase subunit N